MWELKPSVPGAITEPGLVIYRFGAALFYANASRFSDEILGLTGLAPSPVHWLVVDAGAITSVDYTAACIVRELQQELNRRGTRLVFAHVQSDLMPDLVRHRLKEAIGQTLIFDSLHDALAAFANLKEARAQAVPELTP
jgi:MFS superfamily sulfate permease-like transporter